MEENHRERRHVRLLPEQRHRDKRVLCDFRLAVDEREDHDTAHNKQRDDLCRIPREQNTAEVEAEENHERAAEEGEHANPVDGFHPFNERGVLMLDVQKEQDQDRRKAADR